MSDQKSTLTALEQRKLLAEKLKGREFFERRREGKMPQKAFDLLYEFVTQLTTTPADFERDFNKLTRDLFHLGRLWSQLRRDGHTVAAQHLSEAIALSQFTLHGERFAETVPVTMLMLEPEKTTLMIRFLLLLERNELHFFNTWHRVRPWKGGDEQFKTEFFEVRDALLQAFPSLQTLGERYEEEFPTTVTGCGRPFLHAYRQDVASHYSAVWQMDENWSTGVKGAIRLLHVHQIEEPFMTMRVRQWLSPGGGPQGFFAREHKIPEGSQGCKPFAYMLLCPEAEVRQRFTTEQHQSIATWEFAMPEHLLHASARSKGFYRHCDLPVGLHPMKDHDSWRECHPALVSRTTSHGYGAMLQATSTHEWDDYLPENMGKSFLFH